jgi:hypothetical protein
MDLAAQWQRRLVRGKGRFAVYGDLLVWETMNQSYREMAIQTRVAHQATL